MTLVKTETKGKKMKHYFQQERPRDFKFHDINAILVYISYSAQYQLKEM